MKNKILAITILISAIINAQYFYPYVTPEQFGATGNGSVDDTRSLENAINTARKSFKPLFLTKNYYVTRTLEIGNITIISSNATIKGSKDLLYVAKATGTISPYYNLSNSIMRGVNELYYDGSVDFSNGELIKVTSDKYFFADEQTKQGEIQLVESFKNNIIKIYKNFNDVYSKYDNVRIAKIKPASLCINGKLNIEGGNTTSNIGLILNYTNNVYIENIEISKCRYISLWVSNSYNANINGYFRDADRAGEGYGVSLTGAMYSNIKGSSDFCRHAVASSGYIDVVSWENTIQMRASINDNLDSGYSCSIFDSHGSSGSTYWKNCYAVGQVDAKHGGFGLSGRNDYVTDAYAENLEYIFTRGRGSFQDNYVINGVVAKNCKEIAHIYGGFTKNFTMYNVDIVNDTILQGKYAITFVGTKLQDLKITGIKTKNIAGFLNIDLIKGNAPDNLRLFNIVTKNDEITGDRLITCAGQNNTDFENVDIIDCDIENSEVFLGKTKNIKLEGNNINKLQYFVFRLKSNASNIILRNNYIGESQLIGNLLMLQSSKNIVLTGNTIESKNLQGIFVLNDFSFVNFLASHNNITGWYNNAGVIRFVNINSVNPSNYNILPNNVY